MSPGALFLRFVLLVVVILLATWDAHEIHDALDLQIRPDNEQQEHRAIILGSVACTEAITNQHYLDQQIGIDRRAPGVTAKVGKMGADGAQIDKAINRPEQVVLRNVIF